MEISENGDLFKKYFLLIYFGGYGVKEDGTMRIMLEDRTEYDLEQNLRDFVKQNPVNSYVFCVFDTCNFVHPNQD